MPQVLTKEGYAKRKAELDYLKKVKRREISKTIGLAREHGDLKENAEYHAAREEQAMVEAKIRQLESQLAGATILDEESLPDGEVCIGTTVRLEDIDKGLELTYTLVSPVEANFSSGKISTTSPVAKGLMNKKVGEVAEINVPAGIRRYKILEIKKEI
ncbi:MAG: transcription elongation factor GreA [bacterium]|nr:transcription elongation factor GreA [bacterium]